MDIFPKFIIETDDQLGDCLIMSKCTYHKQLATNLIKVKGGGGYKYNEDTITFFGESYDFGKASIEDIKLCIQNDKVFTNRSVTYSIATKHKFFYDIGSEIIPFD